jgi:hypothetical protein
MDMILPQFGPIIAEIKNGGEIGQDKRKDFLKFLMDTFVPPLWVAEPWVRIFHLNFASQKMAEREGLEPALRAHRGIPPYVTPFRRPGKRLFPLTPSGVRIIL